MNEQKILSELLSIESFATELKNKATGLREQLGRFNAPAPKGAKSLSPQQINNLIIKRKNSILQKRGEGQ